MTTRARLLAVAITAALGSALAGRPIVRTVLGANVPHRPDGVSFSYADVDRFALALGKLDAGADTVTVLREYVAAGSRGFTAYAKQFGTNDSTLLAALRRHPAFYQSLRDLPGRLRGQEPRIRAGLARLEALHPGTVFPPVWFLVGSGRAGGQAGRIGVLIGAELTAASPDSVTRAANRTPRSYRAIEDMPALVVHETVHYNHFINAPITYSRQWDNQARALKEGAADFVAELATGRHTNYEAHAYGERHERELWTRFEASLDSNTTGWFFGRPAEDVPSALGYFLGYRIVRSYYARATDSTAAMRAIMRLHDYDAFHRASGYEP
jgi:hypothetical protein